MERFAEGSIIGDAYRIVRPLSAGGMGAVYVAEQLSTGRLRALKLMHHRLQADPKLRDRFVKEARVAASIGSAHVVEVIGAGVEADSGTPWLAMELLEGDDLGAHVEKHGALSFERTRELVEQICHAVGEAHDAGIVHRDLKPENVFIARTRAAGQTTTVKVLDFGIAKLIAEAQTMGTAALGSPAWMAPEQAEAGGEVTPATDVWALGLMTFFMLTGCSYWRTASQASPSVPAFLKEILFEALPLASKRATELRSLERLPAGFDEWFDRCVHREPPARFRSARELFAAFPQATVTAPVPKDAVFEPPTAIPMSTRSFLSAGALDTVPVEVPREVPVEGPEATELRTEPALAPIEPTRIEAKPAPSVPLEPVREASLAAPRRSSWILYALVAAGVLGAAAFWLIGKRPPALETNAGPAPASAASVDAPVVEDTVPATSNASTVASTAPSSQPSHTRPAKSVDPFANAPPFSTFLAENAVRERAKFAVQQCSAHEGPRSLPLSVVFGNDGRVKRVEMSDQLRFQSSGICVFQAMSFIIIPSFSGPEGRVSTTVTLP